MAPEPIAPLLCVHDLFDLTGRVALVTGGGGGLGSAMVRALAAAGARVAVMTRHEASALPVAESITAAGGQAIAAVADVTDLDSLQAARAGIESAFGPVEILVNGAGGNQPRATTAPGQSFFELDPAAIEQVFRLNFAGTLNCCRVFGQPMTAAGRGCIVNVASMAAERPLTRVVTYSAAKAAVVNFTRWLAVHMAREYHPAIRVNALAPGFFLTEQNRYLLTDQATGELTARGRTIVEHTPAGRLGEADELVAALLWLCGPGAAFVTGTVIPVDGGFSAFSGV
jgi:NAD(P)-dependent dehydrogenase (short-subunit alcohol dehydrogenase family)